VEDTVPDTITSWVLSAFAISSGAGLGIAPTSAKVRLANFQQLMNQWYILSAEALDGSVERLTSVCPCSAQV
jgi:Alpha-2-macroglobulin family